MSKSLFVSALALVLTVGAQAQSQPWASKWEWPLLPINQSYNVGESTPDETGVGGVGPYWKDTASTTQTATKPADAATPAATEPAKTATKP